MRGVGGEALREAQVRVAGEDGGASFEPVQVEQLDDVSALIVDFGESTATTKTLLDLDEAALVTKSVEPFFLDGKFFAIF